MRFPEISPVVFSIGPLSLRWYGLMYAISFFSLIHIMRWQSKKGFLPLRSEMVERLFVMLVVFILVGARIFYVVFYGTNQLWSDPLEIVAIWHGGLSFHGGFAGILLASYVVARQSKVPWVSILDTLGLCGPIGLGLGRLGNLINGELYGRVTSVPWGIIFPNGGELPRHPSQLYESLLEGLVLGVFLWALKRHVKRHGILAACFMLGYSFFRIFVEFFREPDSQLGFVLGPFTMGQLLSLGVFVPGVVFLLYSVRRGPAVGSRPQ